VLVYIIGGVTYGEIAALRLLAAQTSINNFLFFKNIFSINNNCIFLNDLTNKDKEIVIAST